MRIILSSLHEDLKSIGLPSLAESKDVRPVVHQRCKPGFHADEHGKCQKVTDAATLAQHAHDATHKAMKTNSADDHADAYHRHKVAGKALAAAGHGGAAAWHNDTASDHAIMHNGLRKGQKVHDIEGPAKKPKGGVKLDKPAKAA